MSFKIEYLAASAVVHVKTPFTANLDGVTSEGQDDDWSFDTEVLFLAKRLGFSIRSLPVVWRDDRRIDVRVLAHREPEERDEPQEHPPPVAHHDLGGRHACPGHQPGTQL